MSSLTQEFWIPIDHRKLIQILLVELQTPKLGIQHLNQHTAMSLALFSGTVTQSCRSQLLIGKAGRPTHALFATGFWPFVDLVEQKGCGSVKGATDVPCLAEKSGSIFLRSGFPASLVLVRLAKKQEFLNIPKKLRSDVSIHHVFHLHTCQITTMPSIHTGIFGFNPFEKYESNWIISPGEVKHEKCLKPPPRYNVTSALHLVCSLATPPLAPAPSTSFTRLSSGLELDSGL